MEAIALKRSLILDQTLYRAAVMPIWKSGTDEPPLIGYFVGIVGPNRHGTVSYLGPAFKGQMNWNMVAANTFATPEAARSAWENARPIEASADYRSRNLLEEEHIVAINQLNLYREHIG